MRVLLAYPDYINQDEQPLGVLYIGALLKQHGHEVGLFYLTTEESHAFDAAWPQIERRWQEKLQAFQPRLIGFSVIVTAFHRSLALANSAKKILGVPVIFGGANPTVEPERTIAEPAVDMVCVGEGEHAMLELVNALEQGEDASSTANIWLKRNGEIIRNEVRPLSEDLDSLPHPDRSLIGEELRNGVKHVSFITARGCPYKCSYCHNPFLQDLYKGKGRYVRFRSVASVIAEIKEVASSYPLAGVTFSDDTFTLHRERALEFCRVYAKEVALPFLCQTRANHVDEAVLTALKEAGCEEVHIGLESGNDHLRNEVLFRNMERHEIVKTFTLARRLGLKTASFNMIGIPFETEPTLWDTINLNRQVRPNRLIHTIFMPLTGTRAKQICQENGWQIAEINASYYTHAFLEQPSISAKKLIAYQYLLDLYVYASKLFYPFIHTLRFLWEHAPRGRALHHRLYRASVFQATSLLKKICLRGN